jgi:hypothetical protein
MARIIRLGRLDSEFCSTISVAQILRFVALSVLPFTGTFCLVNVLSPLGTTEASQTRCSASLVWDTYAVHRALWRVSQHSLLNYYTESRSECNMRTTADAHTFVLE